jgi:ion channel
MSARPPLTPEQLAARERWQALWNLPILLAAFIPLFFTSPKSWGVEIAIGVGSWIVFVVDLVVQRRIVPDYLHRRNGKFDLAVVVFTFPFYLLPQVSGGTALLMLGRLGRAARVLMATKGLRRPVPGSERFAIVAGAVVLLASLSAYQAEHPTNLGFATVGDALWWSIVTLTTFGYGDIVPKTEAGRFAGVASMSPRSAPSCRRSSFASAPSPTAPAPTPLRLTLRRVPDARRRRLGTASSVGIGRWWPAAGCQCVKLLSTSRSSRVASRVRSFCSVAALR